MHKQRGQKLFQIYNLGVISLLIFAFTEQSKLLHTLYNRGRHVMNSTSTTTQKCNALDPIIRANATESFFVVCN